MARKRTDSGLIGLDEQAFELLSRQVKAKEEENRLAQQEALASKLRERGHDDVIQRYAHLGEQNVELMYETRTSNELTQTTITEVQALKGIIREFITELSRRFDSLERQLSQRIGRLEDIELARLSSINLDPVRVVQWSAELAHERKQRELQQYHWNLGELQLSAAKYGMNVPLDIKNDIRYAEEKIEKLEQELKPNETK